VHPDRLIAELNGGKVNPDDYLSKSSYALDEFEDIKSGVSEAEDAVDIHFAHKLLDPGYMALENGYVRRSDGIWYIACLTNLDSNITGEMFDWWFRHCDNTERYRWWHPNDHISCTWDPSFFATQPYEREFGYYIGHIHNVVEKVGGVTQTLQIEFLRPSKFFDVNQFESAGITACVVGRINVKDPLFGPIAVGYLVSAADPSQINWLLKSILNQ
jgi:DAPG hydrolase PhiG domain